MSTTNPTPIDGESLRDRKARLTRESIHTATVRLAYEHGLDAATVAQIAEEAGVSQRTFFNYFAGKEDAIIGTAVNGSDERVVADVVATADFSAGILEETARLVRDVLAHSLGDDDTMRMRRILFMRNPALMQRNADAGSALATQLIDHLEPVLAQDIQSLDLPAAATTRDVVRMIVLVAFAPLRHSFIRPKPPPADEPEPADEDLSVDALRDRFDHSLTLFRTVLEGIRI